MFYDVIVEMPNGSKGFLGFKNFHKAFDYFERINGNYLAKHLVDDRGNVLRSRGNPTTYFDAPQHKGIVARAWEWLCKQCAIGGFYEAR